MAAHILSHWIMVNTLLLLRWIADEGTSYFNASDSGVDKAWWHFRINELQLFWSCWLQLFFLITDIGLINAFFCCFFNNWFGNGDALDFRRKMTGLNQTLDRGHNFGGGDFCNFIWCCWFTVN